MIGKKILHTFELEGIRAPYNGKILGSLPGYPNWYNVVYEEDKEVVYVYDLNTDIESGDPEVLSDIEEGTIKTFELREIKTPYKGKIGVMYLVNWGYVPGYPNWYNVVWEGDEEMMYFRSDATNSPAVENDGSLKAIPYSVVIHVFRSSFDS